MFGFRHKASAVVLSTVVGVLFRWVPAPCLGDAYLNPHRYVHSFLHSDVSAHAPCPGDSAESALRALRGWPRQSHGGTRLLS